MKKKHTLKIVIIALSVVCVVSLIVSSCCIVKALANAAWEYEQVLPENLHHTLTAGTDVASDDTIVIKNIDCNIEVIKLSESERDIKIDDSSDNILHVEYNGLYDYLPIFNPFTADEDFELEEIVMEKTYFTDKPNTTEVWIEKSFIKFFSVNFGFANMTIIISDNFAGNIKFENCAGGISVFNNEEPLNLNSLTFENTAGNIDAKIYADNIYAKNSAGNIKITNQNPKFSLIDVKNSAGNINLKIHPDTKGKFEKSNVVGNMDLFFSRVTYPHSDFTHVINGGEGDSVINVKNSFGNINVGKIE